jgi:hypothetical protein
MMRSQTSAQQTQPAAYLPCLPTPSTAACPLLQDYPSEGDVASVFLAKNAAVVAFVALTIISSFIGLWSAVETVLAGRVAKGALGYKPTAVFSFGTAVWMSLASFATSLIAWAIFASIVTDDRTFYSQEGYPGGAEVTYGPGFALTVLSWILSIVTYGSYTLAIKENA